MRNGIYKTKLVFYKLSPSKLMGFLPQISKKKLLAKLGKQGITEEMMDSKFKDGNSDNYYIPRLFWGHALEIEFVR